MRLPELLLAAVLLAAPAVPGWAQAPTQREVWSATEEVKRHPDLPGTKAKKTLRFRDPGAPPEPPKDSGRWQWWIDLLRWFSEAGRLLMWLAGATAVVALLVGWRRWARVRGASRAVLGPAPPSHVQSLDIRPETLPDAVGAAAAQLWQQGEHRAALSLLYRGALSRLVHGHAVPIRAASTEGECVALARSRLDAQAAAFFARLVAAWQLAVYGARLPDALQVTEMCREFDLQWPAPPRVTA